MKVEGVFDMNLTFVHTAEKVKIDSHGNYYTDGSYDKSVWPRYFRLARKMTFVARRDTKKYEDEVLKDKYNLIDKSKIKVVLIDDTRSSISDFINIKKRIINRTNLKRAIMSSDRVIVRLPCAEGPSAVRIAKRAKRSILIECVGCVWDGLWNYSIKGKVMAAPAYLAMRRVISKADYVLYVTNYFLQKRYPTKGKSIACSNVVLKDIIHSNLDNRRNKIVSSAGRKSLTIGTTAAIDVPHKGHEYVIKALADLKTSGYDFRYEVAGSGDKTRLLNLAKNFDVLDRIDFLGSLRHEKVFGWLDELDVYVQPSKQEGVPRALLEAMSRGCPAVGSNAGGIPEILSPEYIFRKGNVVELVNALKRIAESRHMSEESIRNFNKSKEYHNDILTKRRNDFFDRFMADSNKVSV